MADYDHSMTPRDYLDLADQLIAESTLDELAVYAKLLAMNVGPDQAKVGVLPIEEFLAMPKRRIC